MPTSLPLRTLIWLAFGFAILLLATNGFRPLFNPDEGRYVDIPLEMLQRGNFILPHLNGVVYLEKPPLQYWLSAFFLACFGHNAWAGRLVLGVAWLCIGFMVYRLSRTLYSSERAIYAVILALSGLLMQLMATLLTLDLTLSAWLLMALWCLCEAQWSYDDNSVRGSLNTATAQRRARGFMWGCYAAMALATLTKGLIGLVLPGIGLIVYSVLQRDRRIWGRIHLVSGLILYGLMTLPWFLAVEQQHHGALWFLIVHEHFQRYLTTIHERYRPFWYFFVLLLPALLPWTWQGIRALVTDWRSPTPARQFCAKRLIWVMVLVILLFYSFSDSKLPPYILPMMPLLAILAAGHSEAVIAQDIKISQRIVLALGVGMLGYWAYAVGTESLNATSPNDTDLTLLDHALLQHRLAPWVGGFGVILLISAYLSHRTLRLHHWLWASIYLGGGFLLTGIGLFHIAAASISYRYSAHDLIERSPPLETNAPVYTVATFDWTLPVYLHHPVIPVAWRGELDYGLTASPEAGRETLEIFVQEWRNLPQAYALIPRDVHNQLLRAGLPMTVQAYDFDNVWVSRRDSDHHE